MDKMEKGQKVAEEHDGAPSVHKPRRNTIHRYNLVLTKDFVLGSDYFVLQTFLKRSSFDNPSFCTEMSSKSDFSSTTANLMGIYVSIKPRSRDLGSMTVENALCAFKKRSTRPSIHVTYRSHRADADNWTAGEQRASWIVFLFSFGLATSFALSLCSFQGCLSRFLCQAVRIFKEYFVVSLDSQFFTVPVIAY